MIFKGYQVALEALPAIDRCYLFLSEPPSVQGVLPLMGDEECSYLVLPDAGDWFDSRRTELMDACPYLSGIGLIQAIDTAAKQRCELLRIQPGVSAPKGMGWYEYPEVGDIEPSDVLSRDDIRLLKTVVPRGTAIASTGEIQEWCGSDDPGLPGRAPRVRLAHALGVLLYLQLESP